MPKRIAFPWFFFYRVARLSLLVFIPTLFLMLFFYRSSYKEGLVSQMTQQTHENLLIIDHTLKRAGLNWKSWCENLPESDLARYTLTQADGTIICDSLEEKSGRKLKDTSELDLAIAEGFAFQVRHSNVFQTLAVFAGLRLSNNLVIRKTVPITSLRDDMNRFDRVLFMRIVPFALLSYLLFIFLFYRATRPLGSILSKVEKFKEDIPFGKTLQLLYRKNEWAEIEEALNEADLKLKKEFQRSEQENQKNTAILESIHDNIIAIDVFETILFYNTNFRKNFHEDRQHKELVPKIWQAFTDEQVVTAFRSVLKSGETVSLKGLTNLSIYHPDRYYDLTITSLKDNSNNIKGALGVLYDVTDFKLTEQMRVDFVANVSHEIRTPLTSIKGYTQILQSQQEKIDPSLHLFLEKIITNTERMISLFNDLLNLSVIEAKNLLKFEALSLTNIIESVADDITNNYPHKAITVEHDLKLNTIRGDQRLMEQVLSNLIDNACKYSNQATNIKISSFEKNNFAYIIVADSGPGISKEHLQRIFERFYRVDSSREDSRGTGLGLSIVKHIIAKHGGRIWAESQEPSGTAFVIELPIN